MFTIIVIYHSKTYFVDEEHSNLVNNANVLSFVKNLINDSTALTYVLTRITECNLAHGTRFTKLPFPRSIRLRRYGRKAGGDPMKRVVTVFAYLLLCFVVAVGCSSCVSDTKRYTEAELLEFDRLGDYGAQPGKSLGSREVQNSLSWDSFFEIKGLPKEEYLYQKTSFVTSVATLLIKKGTQEPVLRYGDKVNQVELYEETVWIPEERTPNSFVEIPKEKPSVIIKDRQTIANLLTLHADGPTCEGEVIDSPVVKQWTAHFLFKLSCKLRWESKIYLHLDGSLSWTTWDHADSRWMTYDVTELLASTLNK